ncbi:MAG: hypothetical protein JXA79_09640 [Deltaproteobacteria bacterium]|nr:hypothetical protein [Deltaproteobacteria bacterium]
MMKVGSKIRLIKSALIVSIILGIVSLVLIRQGNAQVPFYYQYQPAFVDPYYFFGGVTPFGPLYTNPFFGYDNFGYGFPSRNAAVLSSSTLLYASLLNTPTAPTTTTVIGLNTAITLAALGGTSISSTTLALLASTPVLPTVTTTPTIGTTTALLLGGGVSTSTLLLLGI